MSFFRAVRGAWVFLALFFSWRGGAFLGLVLGYSLTACTLTTAFILSTSILTALIGVLTAFILWLEYFIKCDIYTALRHDLRL